MTTQAVPIHGPREKMSKFKVNAYTTNHSVCTHLILSLVTNVLSFEKAFSMLKMYCFPTLLSKGYCVSYAANV